MTDAASEACRVGSAVAGWFVRQPSAEKSFQNSCSADETKCPFHAVRWVTPARAVVDSASVPNAGDFGPRLGAVM